MDDEHARTHPEAALLHAFVNTLDLRSFAQNGARHRGGERLASPNDLTDWLAERELLDARDDTAGARATRRDLAQAHRLRAQLRDAIAKDAARQPNGADGDGSSGGADGAGDAGDASFRVDYRLRTAPDGPPTLVPARAGVDAALARIVLAVPAAVASGSWRRLKMCEADDCRWVFYDRTRPGRGRWCGPELCGNRMKTRDYRQRKTAGDG